MNSGDTVRHKLMPLVKSGKVPYTRRVYYAEKEKAERLDTVDRELELIENNLKKNDIDIPENGDSGESQPDCAVQIKGKGKKTKIFKTIKYPFQYYDIIFAVFSIILFFYDVVSDVLLAVHYYALNRWVAFGFTTGFIVLPALISNGQSARWYLVDYEQEQKKLSKKPKTEVTPFRIWAIRIFFTFPLMLGPVVRYISLNFVLTIKLKNIICTCSSLSLQRYVINLHHLITWGLRLALDVTSFFCLDDYICELAILYQNDKLYKPVNPIVHP